MKPHYMLGMTTALAVVLALALPSSVRAQGPALTGKVTSAAEGAMEGVVVTAHKDGSVVSVSVTTNAQGVYSFPEDRLEPGHYNLAIRAVGYDLRQDRSRRRRREDHERRPQARQDQESRRPTHQCRVDDEHPRHRRPEGCPAQLHELPHLERIVRSTHDADEWTQVVSRMMGYGAVSQPIKPQPMLDKSRAGSAGAIPQIRRVSGDHQLECDRSLAIRAEDTAASNRPVHTCHRDRISSGASDHRAA